MIGREIICHHITPLVGRSNRLMTDDITRFKAVCFANFCTVNARNNSIENNLKTIENFLTDEDTYKNLYVLRDAISNNNRDSKGCFDKLYFSEMDSHSKKNMGAKDALRAIYKNFANLPDELITSLDRGIIESGELFSRPSIMTRLLDPSLAYSSQNAKHKLTLMAESCLTHYVMPISRGYEHEKLVSSTVAFINGVNDFDVSAPHSDPFQESINLNTGGNRINSTDFHNVMAHMFVRMAERFGMFGVNRYDTDEREEIVENIIKFESYVLAGRAYEMIAQDAKDFRLSKADQKWLENWSNDKLESNYVAEKRSSWQLAKSFV